MPLDFPSSSGFYAWYTSDFTPCDKHINFVCSLICVDGLQIAKCLHGDHHFKFWVWVLDLQTIIPKMQRSHHCDCIFISKTIIRSHLNKQTALMWLLQSTYARDWPLQQESLTKFHCHPKAPVPMPLSLLLVKCSKPSEPKSSTHVTPSACCWLIHQTHSPEKLKLRQ